MVLLFGGEREREREVVNERSGLSFFFFFFLSSSLQFRSIADLVLTSRTGPFSTSSSHAPKHRRLEGSNRDREATSSSLLKSTMPKEPQPRSKNFGVAPSAGPTLATSSSRPLASRWDRIVSEEEEEGNEEEDEGGRRRAILLEGPLSSSLPGSAEAGKREVEREREREGSEEMIFGFFFSRRTSFSLFFWKKKEKESV